MTPQRIQLRRTRGWRKPDGAVVVARPSRWGNPFTIKSAIENGWADDETAAREFVVCCFEDWLLKGALSEWWFSDGAMQNRWMREHIDDLRFKTLACWCRLDQACHGNILWRAANR